jgi:hypothetical protein
MLFAVKRASLKFDICLVLGAVVRYCLYHLVPFDHSMAPS